LVILGGVIVRAFGWSVIAHAAGVVAWYSTTATPSATAAATVTATATAALADDSPTTIDRVAAVELRTAGDAVVDVAQPGAPSRAPNPDPIAGAAARSSGHGGGAPTLVTARADAATLRVQPYDAATGYQLARLRTAPSRESREDVRATPHPDRTPWLSSSTGRGHRREPAADRRPPTVAQADADRKLVRASMQSERGMARPDVQPNPAATDGASDSERVADRVDQALVSDEKQPAKLELSHPTSPGHETRGRGDGALGYSPDGRGAAPVPTGAPSLPDARALALATYQREYDQYVSDLKRKIDPLWEFPRELAVRLEQGDVLVGFTIKKDGHVTDVRVLKGSGFPSFDKNVIGAIRKAAPFSPLPTTLGTELHVTAPFEGANPAIR
jgi:TonB family protein